MSDETTPRDDKQFMRNYKTNSPDILAAYANFSNTVFADDDARAVPKKYRELMAVAVGISKQCEYCIEAHTRAAQRAGATEEEIAEAVWVASAVGAGAAYTHGRLAFKHVH
jgi:AhpD family alkylhydroperoxidase